MSLIQIQRQHPFGLGTARNAAHAWMAHAEKKYGVQCRYVAGREHDVVYFTRPQADGHVRVGAETFDFYMQLGWILAPFTPSIVTLIVPITLQKTGILSFVEFKKNRRHKKMHNLNCAF